MQYDVIIRNGTIIDGSGMARYRSDVGIAGGKIVTIGKLRDSARETIDAEGHVVAPGFVDVHTHMDAQVFWDPIGTCSCWHGVTSVAMGNCGFSLAPCAEKDKHLVIRNLERAEDISAAAMQAGIRWRWETFAQYLDAVEQTPKGINYTAYVGHSALRTYVMGERAFNEESAPADLEAMKRELRGAIAAGAAGLTTSRSSAHQTPDGHPVASRLANWEEVRELVGVMGEMNAGIFEIAGEDMRGPGGQRDYMNRLKALAIDTGVTVTFGMTSSRRAPDRWRPFFDMIDQAALEGGRMVLQVHSRPINVVLSFETNLPFDRLPVWRDIRKLPLAEQEAALRNPETRRKLVEAVHDKNRAREHAVGAEPRSADFDWMFVMDHPTPPYPSIGEIARERNQDDPLETMIDLALEKHLHRFFLQPLVNENQDDVLWMMRHPRTVTTFSDSGAHVSQIMDSSLQTHVLAHWVREKQALTLEQAVRMLSFLPASHWGLTGRGLLREGWLADVIVFDPERIMPEMPQVTYDLPAGARRLKQKATGLLATVVNGQVLLRNNEHTGALPGRLLRNRLASN